MGTHISIRVDDEPEPGAIIRFSTGTYNYAAVRIQRRHPDEPGTWYTTSSGYESDSVRWLGKTARWSDILTFADDLQIDRVVTWETIKEGRGPSSRSGACQPF